MRLFTGIALGRNVERAVEQMLRELRPLVSVSWSLVENLHITTKFIGKWPEPRLDEIEQALDKIGAPAAFPVSIRGFGYLPDLRHPRMLFAGVQAGPELAELARQTEDALVPLGVAREDRAYTPHLTLARLDYKTVRTLREHIANMKNPDFGTFEVSEFHLYLSTPRAGGGGSVYRRLATFPLGSRA